MTPALLPMFADALTDPKARPRPDLIALQCQIFRATCTAPRPLTGLMPWVIDRRNLNAAWDKVADAEGADTPGSDGTTCVQLASRTGPWLAELAEDLYHRRYTPGGIRWIDIPKAGRPDQTRRIGILTIRDRVVQTAVRQVLEPVLDPTFLPTSFGFRPGRSVAAALDAAAAGLSAMPGKSPPFTVAVPLDVADCFPTIEHGGLTSELANHVGDSHLLDLIGLLIGSGAVPTGRLWWRRSCGLVQGGPLSPMLCNLALHPLDEAAARIGRETRGGLTVFRYADDLLLLARDAATASAGVASLRAVLKARWQKFKAEPRPTPAAAGIDWLGVRLRPRGLVRTGETSFGYVVPGEKVASMLSRLTDMTIPPSDRIDAAAFNLGKWVVSVNSQLRDWRQAYVYADNAAEVFRALDAVAFERVGELLKAISGVSWSVVRRNHLVRLPRGFRTWEVPGGRMTVLSSLSPCAPAGLTRRPAWGQEADPAGSEVSSPKAMGAT